VTVDIRWQQRFQNFERAFTLLRTAMEERAPQKFNQLELEGLVQRFEYTFELAWKTLKDYLEYEGIVLPEITPRAVLKTAFGAKIIDDGQTWIDMLAHRNMMSHTYDCEKFEQAVGALRARYLDAFKQLHESLQKKRGT
jgi:nucleotidyltransferase substrate binding protein (TIGR01987 family)